MLIAGLGSIGRRHLRLLRERDDVDEIIAYRRSASGDIKHVEEYECIDEAFATDPEIGFVTNPPDQHIETALACAEAGCDIFVEKPLSNSRAGIKELCDEVDDRGLVTMVACQLRFSPVLKRVEKLLSEKRYGDALSFEAYSGSYLPDWRPDQDYRQSYSSSPQRGGGAVLDLIHELDYSHWLFGPFDGICGRIGNVSGLDISSEDVAVMTVDGKDVVGTIHVDYCRPVPRRTLEIVCELGVVTADLVNGTVSIETPEGNQTESFDNERDTAFRAQLDHFLNAVKCNQETCNDIQGGKDVLELALKVKTSHQ